jgi:mannitol operon repressor
VVSDELKKRHPHLANFWPYLELLNDESDRGKVLISTGFLEEQLKQILLSFALECPQATDLVDGGNAPLGTFSSRIAACFVLGLITENEHRDLQLIRRIRNDFAHNIHTSFETPSVVSRCSQLHHKAPDFVHPNDGPVVLEPSQQFSTASVCLIVNLINRPHHVSKQRRTSVDWPA